MSDSNLRKAPIDVVLDSTEYAMIVRHYSGKTARRSGVPLINHVNEGLQLLSKLGAWPTAMRAFCLHPLIQNDHEFERNWKAICRSSVSPRAIVLAMEYRHTANAYLCTVHTDGWSLADIKREVGLIIPPVRLMLIADKLQNQKDFLKYHQHTHARAKELKAYFENWLKFLGYEG